MLSVCILGSTGSVGTQAIEVARSLRLRVSGLSTWSNVRLLAEQAREFRPKACAVGDRRMAGNARSLLRELSPTPELFVGTDGLSELASMAEHGIVLNAVVGFGGVYPTLASIDAGHDVALANKETLAAAGSIVMERARQRGVSIRPVDSEHSAIWQCLAGQNKPGLSRLILTASGGPFRDRADLSDVTVEQALAHPNWRMGPKISVDSATMVNKALEVVEAHWLFDASPDIIEIVVHRESIVHSMVEFADGSVIAQLGAADMRTPIQYALTYPERRDGLAAKIDLAQLGALTFTRPDAERFPGVLLGHQALRLGGVAPAVMSAANEAAVDLFLRGLLRFRDIVPAVAEAMNNSGADGELSLEDIVQADGWARQYVEERYGGCMRSLS
ncbi:MAG: 1-deoxy-D-xylulose-5-phosphate reductoisomerase [Bacillota bacterium]|jgi:1-deoxy-D-xylulose-5-phosphate reductoisomerase